MDLITSSCLGSVPRYAAALLSSRCIGQTIGCCYGRFSTPAPYAILYVVEFRMRSTPKLQGTMNDVRHTLHYSSYPIILMLRHIYKDAERRVWIFCFNLNFAGLPRMSV